MENTFIVQDVPIDVVMHISRMVNISDTNVTKNAIIEGLKSMAGTSYVQRGLTTSEQLGLIQTNADGTFIGSEKFKEDFKKMSVDDFPLIARKALQNYPPFLIYLQNLKSGYPSDQSAEIVAGIFNLNTKTTKTFFKKSGLYVNILTDNSGDVKLNDAQTKDQLYITNLEKSLSDDFAAKNLINTLLSSEAVSFFTSKGVDFNRPAEALVEIKSDPKTSLYKIFEFVESCLYHFGDDVGASVKTANGLSELVDAIRSQKAILKNPTNLGKGLGGMRNMTNHGPDKETGKTWTFTEEAALGTSLLLFRYLRSIYLQYKKGIQEI